MLWNIFGAKPLLVIFFLFLPSNLSLCGHKFPSIYSLHFDLLSLKYISSANLIFLALLLDFFLLFWQHTKKLQLSTFDLINLLSCFVFSLSLLLACFFAHEVGKRKKKGRKLCVFFIILTMIHIICSFSRALSLFLSSVVKSWSIMRIIF